MPELCKRPEVHWKHATIVLQPSERFHDDTDKYWQRIESAQSRRQSIYHERDAQSYYLRLFWRSGVQISSLTDTQRHCELSIIMFMVMKRNSTLKRRGCVNRCPRHHWTSKQEVSPLTPSVKILKYILTVIVFEAQCGTLWSTSTIFATTYGWTLSSKYH